MDIVFNWHVTEACNYSCDYCFAKWGRPAEIWKNQAKVDELLAEISSAYACESLSDFGDGNIRLNFAGGEPTLLGSKLIDIADASKKFGIQNSMITNGSLLEQNLRLLQKFSMIGISIDSLNEKTNYEIGRVQKNSKPISYDELERLVAKIRESNPQLVLKFNVVVSKHNYDEVLVPDLMRLNPGKIKIFRELSAGGNNSQTTSNMFKQFLRFNCCEENDCWIEDNTVMTQSYLMIDPYGRLFQNGAASDYQYSDPVHEVGLVAALKQIKFNKDKYSKRYKEVAND